MNIELRPHHLLALTFLATWAFASFARDIRENTPGMRFVHVPAGEFTMGTSDVEEARMEIPAPGSTRIDDETPAHRVVLTRGFWLSKTPLTQAQSEARTRFQPQ